VLRNSAKEDEYAAWKREELKENKYQQKQLPSGQSLIMIPLVFEHHGTWGVKAQNYSKELSKRLFDDDGHTNALEFLTYWRRSLTVTLQKSIARVIPRKLDTLTVASREFANECRDIQLSLH
jgi:hypothetical protein